MCSAPPLAGTSAQLPTGHVSGTAGTSPCTWRQMPRTSHPTRSTDPEANSSSKSRAFSPVFPVQATGTAHSLHVLTPLYIPPRQSNPRDLRGLPSSRPLQAELCPLPSSGHLRQNPGEQSQALSKAGEREAQQLQLQRSARRPGSAETRRLCCFHLARSGSEGTGLVSSTGVPPAGSSGIGAPVVASHPGPGTSPYCSEAGVSK